MRRNGDRARETHGVLRRAADREYPSGELLGCVPQLGRAPRRSQHRRDLLHRRPARDDQPVRSEGFRGGPFGDRQGAARHRDRPRPVLVLYAEPGPPPSGAGLDPWDGDSDGCAQSDDPVQGQDRSRGAGQPRVVLLPRADGGRYSAPQSRPGAGGRRSEAAHRDDPRPCRALQQPVRGCVSRPGESHSRDLGTGHVAHRPDRQDVKERSKSEEQDRCARQPR